MVTCFSIIFELTGRIEIGLQFAGSHLAPHLCIGLILADLRLSGKLPFMKLALIISRSVGLMISEDNLMIQGEIPSKPIALDASKEFIHDLRSDNFIKGIVNLTSAGTLFATCSSMVFQSTPEP